MQKAIKLLTAFTEDTDQASLLVFGGDLDNATGCMVMLKGNWNVRQLRKLLISGGLLTSGKPICKGF